MPYVLRAATAWRRRRQKGTQPFTTASFITSPSPSSCCSKRRQPFIQVILLSSLYCSYLEQQVTPRFFPPAVNSSGETALDIAKRLQHTQCVDLVRPRFLLLWRLLFKCSLSEVSSHEESGYSIQYLAEIHLLKQNIVAFTAGNTTLKHSPRGRIRPPPCVSLINCFYFLTGHLPRWIRPSLCNILFDREWPCFTGCCGNFGGKKWINMEE